MYNQVSYVCTFMQVRFKKAGPKHANRILHVGCHASHAAKILGEKASGSDLAAKFSHVCIAFSIAFVPILPPPIRHQFLAKCNHMATSSL